LFNLKNFAVEKLGYSFLATKGHGGLGAKPSAMEVLCNIS